MRALISLSALILLTGVWGHSQTRIESVKKLPYRLIHVKEEIKKELLEDSKKIIALIKNGNLIPNKPNLQFAFVKDTNGRLARISVDSTSNIDANRQALNQYWNNNKIKATYHIFKGHATNAETNKPTGKFIVIEIEHYLLTGTVNIFYNVKLENNVLVITNATPEFSYNERG